MAIKPILAIDFDGTIHGYQSGWQGEAVISDPPTPGAIDALNEYSKHFTLVIFTTRAATREGQTLIGEWLVQHGFTGDVLDITNVKPPAKVTLDDRAITFTGRWPDVDELLRFEPWTTRPQVLATVLLEESLLESVKQLRKLEAFMQAEFPEVLAPGFAPAYTPVDHAIRLLTAYKANHGTPRLSRREYTHTVLEPAASEKGQEVL